MVRRDALSARCGALLTTPRSSVVFCLVQAGYPAFELQHTPIVTATGIMKNVDPHGIIPIAEGQVMLTAHVGAPSDLNVSARAGDAQTPCPFQAAW